MTHIPSNTLALWTCQNKMCREYLIDKFSLDTTLQQVRCGVCYQPCTQTPYVAPPPSIAYTNSGPLYTFTRMPDDGDLAHWEFGDGAFEDHVLPIQHFYIVAGTYTVMLTCHGETVTTEVTVEAVVP